MTTLSHTTRETSQKGKKVDQHNQQRNENFKQENYTSTLTIELMRMLAVPYTHRNERQPVQVSRCVNFFSREL
eukprot:m.385386 g.385386  ORF g.385386 m.385386 type:complete len:73 (+) comp137467_c0_seq1:52-270(+)